MMDTMAVFSELFTFRRTLEQWLSLVFWLFVGATIAAGISVYLHSGPGSMMVTTLAFQVDNEVHAGGHLDVALKVDRTKECQIASTYEIWHDADFQGEPHRRTILIGNANGPLTRVGVERVLLSWPIPSFVPPAPGGTTHRSPRKRVPFSAFGR